MEATKAEHEPDRPAQHLVPTDDVLGLPGDLQVGSWPVPIPGLVVDPVGRDEVVRRHQALGHEPVRRRSDPDDPLGGTEIGPDIAGVLARRQGRGEPLPPDIAQSMGDAMGADLGHVRIHTGAEPDQLARSVQAVAFTQGADIYFGAGTYAPQTPSGQRLLAHELAHTVQQDERGSGGAIIGRAADPAEAAADRVADGVLSVLRQQTIRRQPDRGLTDGGPTNAPDGHFADGSFALHRTASTDVLRATKGGGSPGPRSQSTSLSRLRTVRRLPADFDGTTASTLKSGWGFSATPWDLLLDSLGAYIKLGNDQTAARSTAMSKMQGLILAWEVHHNVATRTDFKDHEKAKIASLVTLRSLITLEVQELKEDKDTQADMVPRFRGDYVLGRVLQEKATLAKGVAGPSVALIQQALADLSYLASNRITGTFDGATETAMKAFQAAQGITDNGALDEPTMVGLDESFRRHTVVRILAQTPGVRTKADAGSYDWGTAPDALSVGTRDLGLVSTTAAKEAIKTSQVAGPGGALPPFVSNLPAGSYESRLKKLVLLLVQDQYDRLAKGKAGKRKDSDLFDWDHLEAVAEQSKAATDAVFGKFAIGKPMKRGAGIHDAWDTKEKKLKDPDVENKAANWRVDKLLTGDPNVRELDRLHGAIQSRDAEKEIVSRVRAQIVVAKRGELLDIHKAWPAFADTGAVNIQRFIQATEEENRDKMWDLFQTVVHEYLHTLEHALHRGYRGKMGEQAGNKTLREGVVEYFTYTVLESVTYDDTLRRAVEGDYHDDGVMHAIPNYHGYGERANAEKLAGIVGARNVMAAFFLGDVQKIDGTA